MRISDWSSDVCSSDLVEGRRHHVVADRQDREDRLDRARRAQQVADRRLGRRHRHLLHRVAEQSAHRAHLDLVAERRRGAVRVDVVRSEEHTSELQSLMRISYAVFCLKNKKTITTKNETTQQT